MEHEVTDSTGRRWRFWWHDWLGPQPIGKSGKPIAGTDAFYLAINEWRRQMKEGADG